MRRTLLCLFPLFLFTSVLIAQEVPKVEVFGGYSYLNLDTSGRSDRLNFNGFDTNVTLNVNRHWGVEGDFAGHFQGHCDQAFAITPDVLCKDLSYMVGPKLSFRTGRINPFTHVLFGGDTFAVSNSAGDFTFSTTQTRWAMAAGGGMDFTVTPRISVRAGQFDYYMTNHNNFAFPYAPQNNFRVSTGIVFKFGSSR